MNRRSIRAAIVAGGASIVLLAGLVASAAPVQARELEAVDVTSTTTRNMWVAPMWKQYGAMVLRQEDYQASPEGRFVYSIEVGEMWDNGRRCVLTRNGTVILDGKCKDSIPWGGLELPGSGKYALTFNGRKVASWTFAMPSDVPTPLAPAACAITSFRPGLVGELGPTFQVTTNGLCSSGYWYYQADYPDGGQAYRRFRLPTDGVFLVRDLISNTEAVTLSVVFLPRGYQVLTASSLATPAGAKPGWHAVPQQIGY
ncbi:MAG: hypothetical protein Q7V58_03345 [Actinomycetota bacterium]|nr:hypothetical protein [Actinomycetota bacterium]